MEILDKRRIIIQGRSDGDGMENTYYAENIQVKDQNPVKYNSPDVQYPKSFIPVPGKRKEPKFVPYEPYKAAVSPIIPSTRKYENISTHVVIDSQKVSSLASSVIKFNSCKDSFSVANEKSDYLKVSNCVSQPECNQKCAKKLIELEEKIVELEKEKKDLESQFKFQTEVNSDLKKMLIASLSEDMQLKVQYMIEDKVRLGMNVLQFSEEISEKNEEIEKLSVQCDVWKSKFEASSVMVDELARWKVTLSKKLEQAIFALDSILKEHKIISKELCTSYNILRSTRAAFNPNYSIVMKDDYSHQSLIQLAKEIQNFSASIQERLLGRSCPRINSMYSSNEIIQLTPAEHSAFQVLKDFDDLPLLVNNDTCEKLLHHKPGKTACQILPHVCPKEMTVNCCKQCSGEIKVL